MTEMEIILGIVLWIVGYISAYWLGHRAGYEKRHTDQITAHKWAMMQMDAALRDLDKKLDIDQPEDNDNDFGMH